MAITTRSLNWTMCDSVSRGSDSRCLKWTAKAPHNRPSTTIGQPTEERTPSCSPMSRAIGPGSAEQLARRDIHRDERGHAPERRLLARKAFQLGLGRSALGHVARHPVHDSVLDDGPGRPLEHSVRAVLAQVTVLERQ